MAHLTTFSLQVLLNTLQKKWKKKLQGSYEQNFHCATIPYFHNLKLGDGNKPFYKNCESLFTSHHSKTDILLNEKGELVLKNKDIAETFNTRFWSIVKSQNLYSWKSEINDLGWEIQIKIIWMLF